MGEDRDMVEVDIDDVRRLRNEGKVLEALEMIDAHHQCLKKNFAFIRRDNPAFRQKLIRFEALRKGLCVKCGEKKEKIRSHHVLCNLCKKKAKRERVKRSE